MIRRRSASLLLFGGLTVALLPLAGFAAEEAEACPAGPEACGYVTNTVVDAACLTPSTMCNSVRAFIENLDLTGCEPIVCSVVETAWSVDPWATAGDLADNAGHLALPRSCSLSASGPEEDLSGLLLRGSASMSCSAPDGSRAAQMTVYACIQMNAGPGGVGWADMYCAGGQTVADLEAVSANPFGPCVPGPGAGHRWRVRATGQATFMTASGPIDYTAVVDTAGRRLDCRPG